MGLDMYLEKRTYVKNWEHMSSDELHKISIKQGGKVRKDIKIERISNIIEEVAYWRKANAIHKWFVDNVSGGSDDNGRDCYVSMEKLQELLKIVNLVIIGSVLVKGDITNGWTVGKGGKKIPIIEKGKYIKDPTIAKKLLPSTEGFFFGSTDYDQYYYDDLVYTKETIEKLLKEGTGDYYYSSSW